MQKSFYSSVRVSEKYKDYTKDKCLGFGSEGKVYLVRRRSDGKEFAMKKFYLLGRSKEYKDHIFE